MNAPATLPEIVSEHGIAAQAYRQHGMSVIPLKSHDKLPALSSWKRYQEQKPTSEKIRTWWHGLPDANIGLVTGQISGFIVLDVDEARGQLGGDTLDDLCMANEDLPETVTARTGSGGRHLFFRVPQDVRVPNRQNFYGENLDIRGDGGYVVAPPSIHPNGTAYSWKTGYSPDEIEMAECPEWLLDLLVEAPDDEHRHAAAIAPPNSTGSNSEGITLNEWGKVKDGRKLYARDSIWANLVQALVDGHTPTAQELFDWTWPMYSRFVVPRSGSLEEDGAGQTMVMEKVHYALRPERLAKARTFAERQRQREAAEVPPKTGSASRFEFMTISDLFNIPPPEFLVDGLLIEDTLCVVYGRWETFKSFLAIDIGLSVAYGRAWHGRSVKSGKVLYVCGEGAHGISKRIRSWLSHYGLQPGDDFLTCTVMPSLLEAGDVDEIIAKILRTSDDFTLIIVDTVSRALAGGRENDQDHMGQFIMSVDRIRRECGAAVLAVHHTGKDIEKGMRGSSVLPAGADTVLVTSRKKDDDLVKIEVEKQKDAEKIELPTFQAVQVQCVNGLIPASSIVLVPVEGNARSELSESLKTRILTEVDRLFKEGRPLNGSLRDKDRHFGRHISREFDLQLSVVEGLFKEWLENGTIEKARVSAKTDPSRPEGFKALKMPVGLGGE